MTIHVNGQSVCLVPGAHMTITDKNVQSFDQVNPAPYIGYREIRSRELNGNLKAFRTQFNHLSAITGLEPLRNLMKSTDPAMKKICQHMLKTSALLQMLNTSPIPYELQQAPMVTAMQR